LFEQKINVMCDSLATYAVSRAIRSGIRREGIQLLSSEYAAVCFNSMSLTRDLAKVV
jgi:hypothetical protein